MIISDKGTNLTATTTLLKISTIQLDIERKFLPAGTSHMSGALERQLQIIRNLYNDPFTDEQRLTDDILSTLFCKVESVVNSSPLT